MISIPTFIVHISIKRIVRHQSTIEYGLNSQRLRYAHRSVPVTISCLARGDRRRPLAHNRHQTSQHRGYIGVRRCIGHRQTATGRRRQIKRRIAHILDRQSSEDNVLSPLRHHHCVGDRQSACVIRGVGGREGGH